MWRLQNSCGIITKNARELCKFVFFLVLRQLHFREGSRSHTSHVKKSKTCKTTDLPIFIQVYPYLSISIHIYIYIHIYQYLSIYLPISIQIYSDLSMSTHSYPYLISLQIYPWPCISIHIDPCYGYGKPTPTVGRSAVRPRYDGRGFQSVHPRHGAAGAAGDTATVDFSRRCWRMG